MRSRRFAQVILLGAFFLTAPGTGEAHTKASGTAAKKAMMNQVVDARLAKLKHSDAAEFKRETALQKDFTASVKEFCEFYHSHCEGTVCGACVDDCYAAFYDFRAEQARKMSARSLELGVPGGSPATPYAEKFFKSFSENVCQLPSTLWKSGNVPSSCAQLQLKELDSRLLVGLVRGPDTEGDVCAQLPTATPSAIPSARLE